MTSNQIAYMELVERGRSNRANEAETFRHNSVWEAETSRHNMELESQGKLSILEGQRHNLMVERQGLLELQEAQRRNRAQESIRTQEIWEARRHNMSQEAIARNRNALDYRIALMHDRREGEKIGVQRRANAIRNAERRDRYALESRRLSESERHNRRGESQTDIGFGLQVAQFGVKLLTTAGGLL